MLVTLPRVIKFPVQHRTIFRLVNVSFYQSSSISSVSSKLSQIKLADIGEGIAEVELLKWFISVGDQVKAFDRICEVQSDKATVEITSRYDGVVRGIYHQEGNLIKVGAVLVDIETPQHTHATLPMLFNQEAVVAHGGDIPPELTEGFEDFDLHKEVNTHHHHHQPSSSSSPLSSKSLSLSKATKSPAGDMKDFLQWQSDLGLQPYDGTLGTNGVLATPAVRSAAKELNVDLEQAQSSGDLLPSGPGGRILQEDVVRFASRQNGILQQQQLPSDQWRWRELDAHHQQGYSSERGVDNLSPAQRRHVERVRSSSSPVSSSQPYTVAPLRGMRRAMAKSMTAALKVPHLTYSDDAEFDAVLQLRKQLNVASVGTININTSTKSTRRSSNGSSNIAVDAQSVHRTKISSMPIIIKAAALALAKHAIMNTTVECPDCSEIRMHHDINIGVAMDTAHGLVVPVLKKVQHKSILEIAADLSNLQRAASAGKLTEDQLTGGTFTISNIGSIGGTSVVPIVLTPQVAILALGK